MLISFWKGFELYFPLLKTKKLARFLLPFHQSKWKHESMKANLSQKVLKLASNDNYFTKELIVNWILVVYFKLKEIWPLFSTAKDKKTGSFFTSLPPKQMRTWKYEGKSQSKGLEVSFQWQLLHWGIEFKLFISNFKRFAPDKAKKSSSFFTSLVASFVPVFAGACHIATQSLAYLFDT